MLCPHGRVRWENDQNKIVDLRIFVITSIVNPARLRSRAEIPAQPGSGRPSVVDMQASPSARVPVAPGRGCEPTLEHCADDGQDSIEIRSALGDPTSRKLREQSPQLRQRGTDSFARFTGYLTQADGRQPFEHLARHVLRMESPAAH